MSGTKSKDHAKNMVGMMGNGEGSAPGILRCKSRNGNLNAFFSSIRKFCTSKTFDLFRDAKVTRLEVQPGPPR